MGKLGSVLLVGAGPGDPDLLTVRAVKAIERAGAIVHDRLVSPEILALAPCRALLVPVGKAAQRHPVPQSRINEILIDLARRGLAVVRLKGGDPFVFGRGGEEALALRAAGIPVGVVPGITAAQGAAAAAGAPLTQRGLATGLRYVTGHCRGDRPLDLDWAGLADPETTLVIYMGVATVAEIAARLMAHGMPRDLPVLAVAEATTPHERRLVSRLDAIARDAREAGLAAPVLFVLGRVAALADPLPLPAQLRAMAANA
ncbi:MAG: uroporphyrinogen-III C-methyltransferase [Rhodobacteraceae bacterium]|nr:uroporphyrinogen-III C-methyltransferase [Paracoccaceae bacterium]